MTASAPNPTGKGGFVKGQSGNPGGRPPSLFSLIAEARKHSPAALQTLVEIAADPEVAAPARVTAATAVLDRAWGKPFQAITGPDGEKLQVEHHVFVTNLMRQLTAGAVTIDGEALAVEPPKEGE